MTRQFAGIVGFLLILGGAAEAASPALVAAAEKEGAVTWYTVLLEEDAAKPVAEAFRKRYPKIALSYTRRGSDENLKSILDEAKAGGPKADVFDGAGTVVSLRKADLVQPYIADPAADVPDRYKDKDGYWTAQVLYFMSIGYGTDLIAPADVPRSFDGLLNPNLRGRIVWTVDNALNGGLGFIMNVLMTMGDQKGEEYLRRLKGQNLVVDRGGLPTVLDALSDGRYAISVVSLNHQIRIRSLQGKHVAWVMPEATLGLSNNLGLVKGGPHPNAGKLLIDFILSPEGQTVLKEGNHVPSSSKVEAPDPALKNGFTVNYVRPEIMEEQAARAKAVRARVFQ